MRAADYPNPPDEFDAAAVGGPQGVHRRPRSSWSRWWPFLLVLVVVPVLAYAAVMIASGGNPLSSGGSNDSSTAPGDAASTPAESASPEPSASETESPEPDPEPTPDPVPATDLGRTVDVQNSTSTTGLASGAKAVLDAAGFTDVATGNFVGPTPASSVVYYPAAEDVGTAEAVANALGIAVVEESAAEAADGILVVLAGDYQP